MALKFRLLLICTNGSLKFKLRFKSVEKSWLTDFRSITDCATAITVSIKWLGNKEL